jgi:hypothetical protein
MTMPTGRLTFDDVPDIRAGMRAGFPAPPSKTIPQTAQRVAVSAIRVPHAGQILLGITGRGLVLDNLPPFGVR